MEKYPIHIEGIICWLPPHTKGRSRFSPNKYFVALARFTSNLRGPDREAIVSYSPYLCDEDQKDCFNVRLHFFSLRKKENEIKKLIKNSELILMDSYIVIAVCRNLILPKANSLFLDDEWPMTKSV